MPAEKKEQIEKMFSKMDPNGNGYVEQSEFEKYLVKYGISLSQDRASYLFALIQSLNAEMRDKGESSRNGNLINYRPKWDVVTVVHLLGITLNDLLHFFQQETGVEENVDLMEIQEMLQEASKTSELDGCNREDVTQLSCLTEDDGVFRATMRTLLRRQSVDTVDLDTVADQRWKSFAGFERKVEEETVMKGGEGVVDDILPGHSQQHSSSHLSNIAQPPFS